MAPVNIKYIVSFSSQDDNHKASNLISSDGFKRWLTSSKDKSGKAEITIQLEGPSHFAYIDIGAVWCSSLELRVGCSDWPQTTEFKSLAPAVTLMTPVDCRLGRATNSTKMFAKGDFSSEVLNQKWDRLQIICRQPLRKDVQFGLSFIQIKSAKIVAAEAVPQPSLSNKSLTPNREKIQKHFFGQKLERKNGQGELKKKLLKISGSAEDGSEQEQSLSRTAQIVMKASESGGKPKITPRQDTSTPNRRLFSELLTKKQTQTTPINIEIQKFLPSLDLGKCDIEKVTVADLRHKFERTKRRKLTIEEKRTFSELCQTHICDLFDAVDSETNLPVAPVSKTSTTTGSLLSSSPDMKKQPSSSALSKAKMNLASKDNKQFTHMKSTISSNTPKSISSFVPIPKTTSESVNSNTVIVSSPRVQVSTPKSKQLPASVPSTKMNISTPNSKHSPAQKPSLKITISTPNSKPSPACVPSPKINDSMLSFNPKIPSIQVLKTKSSTLLQKEPSHVPPKSQTFKTKSSVKTLVEDDTPESAKQMCSSLRQIFQESIKARNSSLRSEVSYGTPSINQRRYNKSIHGSNGLKSQEVERIVNETKNMIKNRVVVPRVQVASVIPFSSQSNNILSLKNYKPPQTTKGCDKHVISDNYNIENDDTLIVNKCDEEHKQSSSLLPCHTRNNKSVEGAVAPLGVLAKVYGSYASMYDGVNNPNMEVTAKKSKRKIAHTKQSGAKKSKKRKLNQNSLSLLQDFCTISSSDEDNDDNDIQIVDSQVAPKISLLKGHTNVSKSGSVVIDDKGDPDPEKYEGKIIDELPSLHKIFPDSRGPNSPNRPQSPAGRVYRMYSSSTKPKAMKKPNDDNQPGDRTGQIRDGASTSSSPWSKISMTSNEKLEVEEVYDESFCDKCFGFYPDEHFETHYRLCSADDNPEPSDMPGEQLAEYRLDDTVDYTECPICLQRFPQDVLMLHASECGLM